MNEFPIIVFDFETTGIDTKKCYPIQVAGLAIDPRKLELIPGGTFESMMCPEDVVDWEAAEKEWKVALDINHKTIAQIRAAPKEGEVWKSFSSFVNKFNPKNKKFSAPIAAGQNIDRFDIPIADRLNEKHKVPFMFNDRISIDLKNSLFMWFEGNNELPNYSMTNVRPYFGISEEGAHSADTDVAQTAELIIRFMKMHRRLFSSIPFRNSLSNSKFGVSPQ